MIFTKKIIYFLSILALQTAQAQTANWFVFHAPNNQGPSVIDRSAWLDAPAGKHGFLQQQQDKLVFADGTPVKFWGVNIASGWPFVPNPEASQWAQYLARYGVNAVRFHKFTQPGLTGATSTVLDEAKFKNLDYFKAQLRERGIYYGWSHIYGHKPRPGDKNRLLAYDEVVEAGGAHLKGSTIGLVNFAPDLQDLSIELTVNMLQHRNPYTNLRYADDPALTFIELQNEDNLFFATAHNWVMACPTYKKLFCEQFSDWLTTQYGTEENLLAAWGPEALNAWPEFQKNESLSKRNIYPLAHHGYLGSKSLQNPKTRKRLLDTARFLYETQNKFYERYVQAIRATGYKGTIVASCWQAGDAVAHYYNLHSDYLSGLIDRHNYFGGGVGGHQLKPGKVENQSMLAQPGSGLLGTGMQAVVDRPFALSEWMAMLPNEWTAESAPLVAVYGMGLQGWDASYVYASNQAEMTPTVEAPRHGVYNADSPLQMALYPALSTMLYRGDIKEGAIISSRNVHMPGLSQGEIGFNETVEQSQDIKKFAGNISPLGLAAGKMVVAFPNKPIVTPKLDIAAFSDTVAQTITSNTDQLQWHYGQQPYFTVNSPGTKAVVGFTANQPLLLGDVTVQTPNPFAVVFLTSLDKIQSTSQAKRILITTVARARNTGMQYNADGSELLQVGQAPLLLEPVQATIQIKRIEKATLHILDHAGRRTGKSEPIKQSKIVLNGAKHQTLYYELEYK